MTDENTPYSEYKSNLEHVIETLRVRFDRMPTDKEVYRFVWGDLDNRQRIWDDKGLPENQR